MNKHDHVSPCPLRREVRETETGIKKPQCTLPSRTLPPSWSTFISALSSPAEAEAEAEASSWLFPSRCTELSAPMANNQKGELFSSLATFSLKTKQHSTPNQDITTVLQQASIQSVQIASATVQLRPGVAWIWSDEV